LDIVPSPSFDPGNLAPPPPLPSALAAALGAGPSSSSSSSRPAIAASSGRRCVARPPPGFSSSDDEDDQDDVDTAVVVAAAQMQYTEAEEVAHALEFLRDEEDESVVAAYLETLRLDRLSPAARLATRGMATVTFGQLHSFVAISLCSHRLKFVSPNIGLLYSTTTLQL
ncbi:hypothetical protein HK405_000812, partial [Cladochytrium tenue]